MPDGAKILSFSSTATNTRMYWKHYHLRNDPKRDVNLWLFEENVVSLRHKNAEELWQEDIR